MTRILVIDDAPTLRLYYRQVLGQAGYAVDEALNAIEGLERALTAPYDLYVVDINLPGMDGLTMLRTLRQEDIPQGAAMVVTTETDPAVVTAAARVGANLHTAKPVRADLLLAQVRALVGPARPASATAGAQGAAA
jgi:two-component system chemotaxis response regulator CheY